MSLNLVYGETSWAIILAEAVDSSGGSAGDGITVNITSTTPANNYMFLFGNSVKTKLQSKDKTQHMVKARSRTTKLGNIVQTLVITKALVPSKDITELNDLDDQIADWMINGNGQSSSDAIYAVVRMKVGGSWRYKTFRNSGTKQNWLKSEIKSYEADLSNARLLINLKLEESDT